MSLSSSNRTARLLAWQMPRVSRVRAEGRKPFEVYVQNGTKNVCCNLLAKACHHAAQVQGMEK